MDKLKENKFFEKLSQARIKMHRYKSSAFFTTVSYSLKTIPTFDVPTMGTDGFNIYINPDFFEELSVEDRVFILLHETMHVVLGHMTRKGHRNHKLWNVAGDYVINQYLVQWGLTMPESGLYDSRFKNMTTEQVYDILHEENNLEEPDYDDLMPKSASHEGLGGEPSLSSAEIEKAVASILQKSMTICKMSNNKEMKLTKELERYFDKLNKPKINLIALLSRFLSNTSRAQYTLRTPNRKFFPKLYLPSLRSDGLSRVDFVLDTSGSILPPEFTQFVSEVDTVLKHFKPECIGFTQFDHRFLGTQEITKFKDIGSIKFKGGGGTDITETLEEVSKYNTKCIIIFTDGYLNVSHLSKPKMPVLWCVHGDNKSFKAPFGQLINFDLEK